MWAAMSSVGTATLLREELGRTNEQPIGRCGRMLGFGGLLIS